MATKKKAYPNKKIVFDDKNSLKDNPIGSLGFGTVVVGVAVELFRVMTIFYNPETSFVGSLFVSTGLGMSIVGLFKKPNGLPVIGVSISAFWIIFKYVLILIARS